MTTNAITPLAYPLLNAIFVRPSLLEAKVAPAALSAVIPANDTDELKQLQGRKAEKFAKRWAPLLVHNLLHGALIEDDGLAAVLNRAESRLRTVSGSEWAAAFRHAGETGVPPSALISRMPLEAKKRLHAETKAWRETANMVEKDLAAWAVSAAEKLKASYSAMAATGGAVSLKKLAKFTPRAA
jgi:hypothetical protein